MVVPSVLSLPQFKSDCSLIGTRIINIEGGCQDEIEGIEGDSKVSLAHLRLYLRSHFLSCFWAMAHMSAMVLGLFYTSHFFTSGLGKRVNMVECIFALGGQPQAWVYCSN